MIDSRYGFIGDDGKLYLTRCPECKLENWAFAVSSGQCAWCGHKPANVKPYIDKERGDA